MEKQEQDLSCRGPIIKLAITAEAGTIEGAIIENKSLNKLKPGAGLGLTSNVIPAKAGIQRGYSY